MGIASIEEQIEALIHHTTLELAKQKGLIDKSGKIHWEGLFTVKRGEIENYVKHKYDLYHLPRIYYQPDLTKEGFFIIPDSNGFLTYYQERRIQAMKKVVRSEEGTWKVYFDYVLSISGTGSKWE